MKRGQFLALIAGLPALATADGEHPWLKQADPNNLGLFVSVDKTCPFSKETLTEKIEGEFLRARIRPTKSLFLNLTVYVNCLSNLDRNGAPLGYTAAYQIFFGTRLPSGVDVLYESPDRGGVATTGKGEGQYLVNAIGEGASEALTAYLKANLQ